MPQRVADYVVQKLVDAGVTHVFLITGGGAMHLNDAFGRNSSIHYVCNHHEQASAMAAEAYTRVSNKLCALNVTTGPGGTNAITGVYGAYVDSIPMFVVSGQVKLSTTVASSGLPLRQLGDQEVDIVRMVQPITKYAVMVTDPKTIRYHLEKALFLATYKRPGPVWIDVPIDIQGALIEPHELASFNPLEEGYSTTTLLTAQQNDALNLAAEKLKQAKRPVLMVGSGVHLSNAHEAMLAFAEKIKIPVVTAWNAHDLLWDDHPLYAGRPGTVGDRAGNFAVQNADVLLVVGSRLNIRQISYNYQSFARHAYKIIVDIDELELQKPTIKPDLPIVMDAKQFFAELSCRIHEHYVPAEWLAWCKERVRRYPVVLPEYWNKEAPVNPYCFVQKLTEKLNEDDIIVCGNGTACVVGFQAAIVKKGQRLFTNSGSAPMGYDLPAAIGASIAYPQKRIICLAGDGSIMMNLQELQTIIGMNLPVFIFVLNNNGYHSIRQTQQNFFPDGLMGLDASTGVTFPCFEKLAAGFGFPYFSCRSHSELDSVLDKVLQHAAPLICEIFLDPEQPFAPKLASRKLPDGRIVSSPLEDLAPFLSDAELQENMFYPIERRF